MKMLSFWIGVHTRACVANLQRTGILSGDTMGHIPKAFYDAAKEIHRPIAMEGEAGLTSTWDLNYITLGWAEGWVADEKGVTKDIPDVDKPIVPRRR